MSKVLRYDTDEQCPVRHGDRPFAKGDTVSGPSDLLDELAKMPGWVVVDLLDAPPKGED